MLGRSGPRLIAGDLNHDADSLAEIQIWKQQGWVDAQTLAYTRWGRAVTPTCKGSTVRDYVFLSPEAAAMCQHVEVQEVFQEHSLVIAKLAISAACLNFSAWPLPSEIPCQHVDVQAWQAGACFQPSDAGASDAWLRGFSAQFEASLDGFFQAPSRGLPARCKGRARRTRPSNQQLPCALLRRPRCGEEGLSHDFVGKEVHWWYKQLRRLQSACHALKSAKTDAAAVEYRLLLWRSIVSARGFKAGLLQWWSTREVRLAGCPSHFPPFLPSHPVCVVLFEDFRLNFRRFEAWHVRCRMEVLSSRYKSVSDLMSLDLREPKPSQVDTLQVRTVHLVSDVDSAQGLIALETSPNLRGHSEWILDGVRVQLTPVESQIFSVSNFDQAECGFELEQVQLLTTPSDIHAEFISLWKPRWNKHKDAPTACWSRILDFLPSGSMQWAPITVPQWRAAVNRFKPRAARGPDGFSKQDLVHMPDPYVAALVQFLSELETGQRPWPEQLLHGLICSLDKQNGRTDAQGFRPICLFSMIYRAWAGIRAREALRFMEHLMPEGACGFLRGREAAQVWVTLESSIELALQGATGVAGFSTDLVKAFNNLPREPIFQIGAHVGLPGELLTPWRGFVDGSVRHFLVRQAVSEGLESTCGFLEGCPLSPLAMVLVDLLYHRFLHEFRPAVHSLSFVDNLSGIGPSALQVAMALKSTESFCEALDLELDQSKTFV